MTVTTILIGFTVVVSLLAFSRPAVMQALMMNPYSVRNKSQYYRFVTSGFIHGSHMHLLVNMFSFYFFGTAMESVFNYLFGDSGEFYFVALYFLAIVFSDIPTFWKQRNNPNYNSLGASGGIAAVIFAFILFMPLQKICIYIAFCMPGFIAGLLYIVYSYYQGKKSQDNINHDAHLFGALFGLIFCVLIYPTCIPNFIEQISSWINSL